MRTAWVMAWLLVGVAGCIEPRSPVSDNPLDDGDNDGVLAEVDVAPRMRHRLPQNQSMGAGKVREQQRLARLHEIGITRIGHFNRQVQIFHMGQHLGHGERFAC